jgi:hypothetical protein
VYPLCPASLGLQVLAALIGLACRKLPEPELSSFLQLPVSSARLTGLLLTPCSIQAFNVPALSLTFNVV